MIRKFISIARAICVGPVLDRLSRLQAHEVSNLVLAGSSDPVIGILAKEGATAHLGQSASMALPADLSDRLEQLMEQQSRIMERLEVVERLLYKSK